MNTRILLTAAALALSSVALNAHEHHSAPESHIHTLSTHNHTTGCSSCTTHNHTPGCSSYTAQDQSLNAVDQDLAQRIRRALVEDSVLSINAKNIKVIVADGHVTLRGPVNSKEERSIVVAKARQIAGRKNVDSHIDVTH